MEAIAFVLWVCGWPLALNLSDYFIAKTREITEVPHTVTSLATTNVLALVLIFVGAMLYSKI